jgi:hypothetical protein
MPGYHCSDNVSKELSNEGNQALRSLYVRVNWVAKDMNISYR